MNTQTMTTITFAVEWANATRRVLDRKDRELAAADAEITRLRSWLIDEIGYVPSGYPEPNVGDAA